jgi:hypothetical protein
MVLVLVYPEKLVLYFNLLNQAFFAVKTTFFGSILRLIYGERQWLVL